MEIFEVWAEEGCEAVLTEDIRDAPYRVLYESGASLADGWVRPLVSLISHDERGDLLAGDFLISLWGGAVIFRPTVLEKLGTLFQANGEVLPMNLDRGGEVYLFNPRQCDCFLSGGYQRREMIIDIQREWREFDIEKCKERDIFVVPEEPEHTYVSERFVKKVHEFGLKGIRFSTTRRL